MKNLVAKFKRVKFLIQSWFYLRKLKKSKEAVRQVRDAIHKAPAQHGQIVYVQPKDVRLKLRKVLNQLTVKIQEVENARK